MPLAVNPWKILRLSPAEEQSYRAVAQKNVLFDLCGNDAPIPSEIIQIPGLADEIFDNVPRKVDKTRLGDYRIAFDDLGDEIVVRGGYIRVTYYEKIPQEERA